MGSHRNGANRKAPRHSGSASCPVRSGIREKRANHELANTFPLITAAVRAWEIRRGIAPTIFHR